MHSLVRDPEYLILALAAAAIAGYVGTVVSPILALVLVAAVLLVIFFLAELKLALLALLIIRSNIDALHSLPIASSSGLDLNAASILGIALVLLGVYYILANHIRIFRSPVAVPYAIFLAVSMVGLLVSSFPFQVVSDWMRLASVFILYVLMVDAFRTGKDINKVLLAYFLSSVVPVLLALYQFATGQGVPVDGFYRVYGTFVVPPVLAFYLVGLIPVAVVALTHARALWIKWLLALWLVVLFVDLLATYTRGAWVGASIALIVMAGWRYRKLLVALPVVVLVVIMVFPQVTDRFADLGEDRSKTGYGEANTLAWRTKFWTDSILSNLETSPVVGMGLGFINRTYYTDPHNDYLRLYVETGFLGFASYIAVLALLLSQALHACRRATSSFHKDLSMAFVAVLLAYATMSIADNIILGPALQWYFWAQAAIVQTILELPSRGQLVGVDTNKGWLMLPKAPAHESNYF